MWRVAGAALGPLVAACGSHFPAPPLAPSPNEGLIDVTSPPPAAHVEFVPERPRDDAVWIDGPWLYDGRWRWDPGGWVVAPRGAAFAPWRTFRRFDGTLVLAPSTWRDAHGAAIPPPPWLARAEPAHAAQEPETKPEEEPHP